MPRTLDIVPTARPTVPPPLPPPPSDAPTGRRAATGAAIGVAAVLALVAAAALGWWAVRMAGDRVDAVEYDTAGAIEGGVRPLVSDRVGELGNITAVTVKRTPDPAPARVHLLARAGDERPRLSVVTDSEPVSPLIDGWLADGRPYEVGRSEGQYVSLLTVGTEGQYVSVMGREIAFDELVQVAAEVAVGGAALDRLPDGWVEIAVTPMPPWRQGFGTYYDFEGGRQLAINVERAVPGRDALAAFGDTEPVDLGTEGWAYRYRPPNSGVLFEWHDVVVDLKGDFSEAELVLVTHTLREMLPSEHPILQPDVFG